MPRGAYAQGWGLSVLLHALVGAPFVCGMVMVAPSLPETLVLPFRWDVSIVWSMPPPVVTAALPSAVAAASPAERGDHRPTEDGPQAFDAGPEPAITSGERPAEQPPATGPAGQTREPRRRATNESAIAKTDSLSVPFVDLGEPGPPLPDVSPRLEGSPRVRATLARPTVMQRPQPIERLVRIRSTLPDYGWLSTALRVKIEQAKRYPPVARTNRWQGQVLVQFSVRHDGYLVDPRVESSSGHLLLDQAALETVREASPVLLQHPLGRSFVVVSLPLTYQLE